MRWKAPKTDPSVKQLREAVTENTKAVQKAVKTIEVALPHNAVTERQLREVVNEFIEILDEFVGFIPHTTQNAATLKSIQQRFRKLSTLSFMHSNGHGNGVYDVKPHPLGKSVQPQNDTVGVPGVGAAGEEAAGEDHEAD